MKTKQTTARQELIKFLEQKDHLYLLDKVWDKVEEAVFEQDPAVFLSRNFGPQSLDAILRIVATREQEIEEDLKLNERILEECDRRRVIFDDDVLDEVVTYAIAYPDRIEFVANENGWGDLIPKKHRKYIGGESDRRWQFPLSMLNEIRSFASFILDEEGNVI